MTFELLRTWIGGGMTVVGGLFLIIGAVGLLRMPDVFTRLHAASVIDTAGAGFIFTGLLVIEGFTLVGVKLIFLILMLGLIGPVASHAVARAALHAGIKPLAEEAPAGESADGTEERPSSKP